MILKPHPTGFSSALWKKHITEHSRLISVHVKLTTYSKHVSQNPQIFTAIFFFFKQVSQRYFICCRENKKEGENQELLMLISEILCWETGQNK